MLHVLISASSFDILPLQLGQNPYIDCHSNPAKVQSQHSIVANAFTSAIVCSLPKHLELPDIVFAANAGLSLPRLGYPILLLPQMKYPQRQSELPFLKQLFRNMNLPTIDYPGVEPFEGQAELKWFDGGRKAVCGYGFRSTKQTFVELDRLFGRIYGKDKPELLVLKLASPNFYHLDVAMLEYDNKCIVHRTAFSPTSIQKLKHFLGKDKVTVLDTLDLFCLNAVVDGPRLLTHKLKDPLLKPMLQSLTGRTVRELNTSEFEKSGGSVRCLVLDLFA
jgi:N-dimethylarginine dimethylaminohydrolase